MLLALLKFTFSFSLLLSLINSGLSIGFYNGVFLFINCYLVVLFLESHIWWEDWVASVSFLFFLKTSVVWKLVGHHAANNFWFITLYSLSIKQNWVKPLQFGINSLPYHPKFWYDTWDLNWIFKADLILVDFSDFQVRI